MIIRKSVVLGWVRDTEPVHYNLTILAIQFNYTFIWMESCSRERQGEKKDRIRRRLRRILWISIRCLWFMPTRLSGWLIVKLYTISEWCIGFCRVVFCLYTSLSLSSSSSCSLILCSGCFSRAVRVGLMWVARAIMRSIKMNKASQLVWCRMQRRFSILSSYVIPISKTITLLSWMMLLCI